MYFLEKLEDTILYDAGLAVDLADALSVQPEPVIPNADLPVNDPVTELVVIDSLVADKDSIIQNRAGIEYHVLNSQDDINSLSDKINNYSSLKAIHIISHGSEGEIELAGQLINSDNLNDQISFINAVKNSLHTGGDLLLYGCNVADSQGNDFIRLVADLTQADVAASDDLTGSSLMGGDWDLEVSTGEIESDALFVDDYNSLLRTIRWNVGATGGIFNGHLADGNQQWEFRGGNPSIIQLYHVGNDVWARALDEGTVTVYFFESGGRGDAQEPEQHTFIFSNPNQAPTGEDQQITAIEDTYFQFTQTDFSTGYSDLDGDPFSGIRIDSLPAGELLLNGTQINSGNIISAVDLDNLVYRSPLNEIGSSYTAFEFSVYDGTSFSVDSYTMTVDVNGVNDAPVLITGSAADSGIAGASETLAEDTLLNLSIGNYIYDPDGDILSLSVPGSAGYGSLIDKLDGTLTYTPELNFFGDDLISITVTDGEFERELLIPIAVTPVNDAPTGQNQTVSAIEDTDYSFDLSDFISGYSDVENDPLAGIRIDSLPEGSLELNGQTVQVGDEIVVSELSNLTFKASLNEYGNSLTSFEFSLSDDSDYSLESYSATINVTGVNDAPQIVPGSAAETGIVCIDQTTDEDVPLTLNLNDYAYDVDNDVLLPIPGNVTAENGTVTDNGDGTVIYIPDSNYFGSDIISLTVTDGEFSLPLEIPLQINAVNDAPVVIDDFISASFNTPTSVAVLANDYDVEGDTLSINRIISATNGTAVINGHEISFAPDHNFIGQAEIIYEVSDGQDTSKSILTVTVERPVDFNGYDLDTNDTTNWDNRNVVDFGVYESSQKYTLNQSATDGEYSITTGSYQYYNSSIGVDEGDVSDGEYSISSPGEIPVSLHTLEFPIPLQKQFQSEIQQLITKL